MKIDEILKAILYVTRTTKAQILGDSRLQMRVFARMAFTNIAIEQGYNPTAIANTLQRHRTLAYHYINNHKAMLKTSTLYSDIYTSASKTLNDEKRI